MLNKTNISSKVNGHAVVVGGSVAGLLTARILCNHFHKITIIERDFYPEGDGPRKGLPQGHHQHFIMAQGQKILEQLFPGIQAELGAAGAPLPDMGMAINFLFPTGWGPLFRCGQPTFVCSRPLVESRIRSRVAANSKVNILENYEVTGLLPNSENTGVLGVYIHSCGSNFNGEFNTNEKLKADLVVDTSGRMSSAPKWLEKLGYGSPEETVVNAFLGYATRWYERPTDFDADWKGSLMFCRPPHFPRGGMIFSEETGLWIVTLLGSARDYPPTDELGFLEFARSLPSSRIYEAIKNARPLSPIYGYRNTRNCWRHYEKMTKWPEGFVALGDAVCAFNPVYGQGITVCILSAIKLDECLRKQRNCKPNGEITGLSHYFQKQLARVNAFPWRMATAEDFRWPSTEGSKPKQITRFMHWYLDQVIALIPDNPEVYRTFLSVMNMIRPPRNLFEFNILVRVMLRMMKINI